MDSLGHPTPHNPHWPGLAQFFFYGTSLFVSGAALPLPFPGLGILSFFNSSSRSFFGSPLRRASPSYACDGRPLTPFTGHPFPRTTLSPRSALRCARVPPFTGPHFPALAALPFAGPSLCRAFHSLEWVFPSFGLPSSLCRIASSQGAPSPGAPFAGTPLQRVIPRRAPDPAFRNSVLPFLRVIPSYS